MRNYEITFIVDPVLSGDEIKTTAQNYIDHLKSERCEIVHLQEMGLRQLAYPIQKRTSGIYYSLEFTSETGEIVKNLEIALKRDERVIRHLLISLDKFAVQFNEDKRNGKFDQIRKLEKVAADSGNKNKDDDDDDDN